MKRIRPAVRYEDRTYDLRRIESVWYVLTPFGADWRGPAHSFLSFGFSDSQFVAISVEARREAGESYALLRGLLEKYDLMYVIGDERDLLGARVFRNEDDVYVYPLAHELGLLDTELPLEAARHRFKVNGRVRRFVDSATFSVAIRGS